MKLFILILAAVLLASTGSIYSDEYTEAMTKAIKKMGDAANKSDYTALKKIRGDFERILQLKKDIWMVNYYMAFIDMMMSYDAVQSKNNDDVKKYTESAIDLLNKSTDMKDDFAEAYILKMAVNSNRWIYEMDKMNDIIAKGTEAKDMAKKLEPNNPRFYLIDGYNVFYTPENFGGGVDKALPLFEKSWENFQTFIPKDETYPNWGKDQAAGMIAMCLIKQDKLDDAKKWIDTGLESNPESGLIKNMVMPEYEKAKK